MNILVTGANGFIGRNLCVHLKEAGFENIQTITRIDNDEIIDEKVIIQKLWDRIKKPAEGKKSSIKNFSKSEEIF